jgi:hypothetical protein
MGMRPITENVYGIAIDIRQKLPASWGTLYHVAKLGSIATDIRQKLPAPTSERAPMFQTRAAAETRKGEGAKPAPTCLGAEDRFSHVTQLRPPPGSGPQRNIKRAFPDVGRIPE